jgi:hypothetical protein
MPTVSARIIPEPPEGTRTVLEGSPSLGPFMRGNGPTTYVCGLCRNILVENMFHGQISNIVFKCPKCQSFNEIP